MIMIMASGRKLMIPVYTSIKSTDGCGGICCQHKAGFASVSQKPVDIGSNPGNQLVHVDARKYITN